MCVCLCLYIYEVKAKIFFKWSLVINFIKNKCMEAVLCQKFMRSSCSNASMYMIQIVTKSLTGLFYSGDLYMSITVKQLTWVSYPGLYHTDLPYLQVLNSSVAEAQPQLTCSPPSFSSYACSPASPSFYDPVAPFHFLLYISLLIALLSLQTLTTYPHSPQALSFLSPLVFLPIHPANAQPSFQPTIFPVSPHSWIAKSCQR